MRTLIHIWKCKIKGICDNCGKKLTYNRVAEERCSDCDK